MGESGTKRLQTDDAQAQANSPIPPWVYGKRSIACKQVVAEGKSHRLKRPFDIIFAVTGLILASPLWLIFAVAIKLQDRGPIFFAQVRWGKDGSKIRVYKFRTMVPEAEAKFGNIQAQENYPRVTRVGRFLRATSLDEMPQLLNIAKGDMSWVGPRALPIDEIQVREGGEYLPDEVIPGFEARSKLRPGLTGIQQVFTPRDVPRELKYQYDAIYAGSQSIWLDIRLILLSLWITLRARWEARGSKL